MFVDFNILNQLGSPAINSNTFANRPAAGQTGRLFVSTDTFEIYRDNGTTWDLIGGPGSSTITGTGTATQVAYFTSSQAIGSSANLFWDNTNTRLGIGTSTPGVRLDIHGTGNMLQINSTSATANALMSFQRTGTNVWRLGDQYNGGSNFFELHNTALANNAIQVLAASNEATLLSVKTYSTGNAIGVAVQHNLTIPNAVNVGLAAIGGLNSNLNLTLGGSTTVGATGRQGLEGSTSISFTGAGTLTMTQGSTVRAFSALSSVYSFNGSAVGTITHLAGLRICFPDNVGSAVNITNNYALLINNQTTGTGTVTYTNRWGIYQEGASDLNYMAANLLLGSTVNNGNTLQVTGNGNLTGDMTADAYYLNGMTANNGALYWTSDRVTLANYNTGGTVQIETNAGTTAAIFAANYTATFTSGIGTNGYTGSTSYAALFNGSVGIGTNSPATYVHIKNDQNAYTWARIDNQANNALAYSGLQFGAYGNTWGIAIGSSTANSNSLTFVIDAGGNNTELMRITTGGNVLIGTTTDTGEKLQTNGNGLISGSIKTAAPSGGTAKPWKFGNVASVTPTAQNRTIELEVDGTTYYLTAKTTND